MAYLKITDIDGKEHELHVLNEDRDVLISRGFGKFVSITSIEDNIINEYEDKISDLSNEYEYNISDLSNEYEDKISDLRSEIEDARADVMFADDEIAELNDVIAKLKKEVSIYKERAETIII